MVVWNLLLSIGLPQSTVGISTNLKIGVRVFPIKVLYMAKHSRGETFTFFVVFHPIVNLFQQNMALLIGSVSLQACYHESFPANNHFTL